MYNQVYQKSKFISILDIYFYFKSTQMETQYQSIGDCIFLLSWSHIQVQKCSKGHLVSGISPPSGPWYIHPLTHLHSLWHYPYTQVPYILPCSRTHGFFRCYSGVPGKSTAWGVETLLDPPRHLETFCCSNGWYTTGNSETLPLDHLPIVTTIYEYILLLSHHAGNGESVVFFHLCRLCSGVGYNFLRFLNLSGGFIVILYPDVPWMVWARTLPGTYCHLSLLFPSESAPHLPQGIFSGLELEKLCLLSSEISPNPLSSIHGANRQKWSIHS